MYNLTPVMRKCLIDKIFCMCLIDLLAHISTSLPPSIHIYVFIFTLIIYSNLRMTVKRSKLLPVIFFHRELLSYYLLIYFYHILFFCLSFTRVHTYPGIFESATFSFRIRLPSTHIRRIRQRIRIFWRNV